MVVVTMVVVVVVAMAVAEAVVGTTDRLAVVDTAKSGCRTRVVRQAGGGELIGYQH